ncbi:putative glycoside hydrolase [Paenibacillus tarimensis]|uniref:putative glycoside hydrolase n=1 Tax=Paenibacillus tarimensis TaxID=416012 RepID=UPI001F2B2FDB|nr:putative glycoside hydrolase [Paenibacillus tarimensis]MCF2945908.1 putative glycoside hydrolase [Paenibacillus tarimensis]
MVTRTKPWSLLVAVLLLLPGCGEGATNLEPRTLNTHQEIPSLEDGSLRNPALTAQPKQLGRIANDPKVFPLRQESHPGGQGIVYREPNNRRIETFPETETVPQEVKPQPRSDIKGIYVSRSAAGSPRHLRRLIKLIKTTDLNAIVLDVKDDYGRMTYDSSLHTVHEVGADERAPVKDIHDLIRSLKEKEIYLIGRVVTFKDPLLAEKKVDWAIHRKDGSVWRDRQGFSWVNPYLEEVQHYNTAIAKEAAQLGFDEIQFDYVRFPDNGAEMDKVVEYMGGNKQSKSDVIQSFLHESAEALHASGSVISADVFGLVTSSKDDMGIGQTWRAVASEVDIISPMTYPSHYSDGIYGVAHPDLEPGKIIRFAMRDAGRRNEMLSKKGVKAAHIRPWLQSFTANWVHPHQRYGPEEIREQIRAAQAEGVNQYLLWSASCRYPYK